jgi:hypothetical protein
VKIALQALAVRIPLRCNGVYAPDPPWNDEVQYRLVPGSW